MSNAFRNSLGGSIMERFENVSKLLFLKMYEERHPCSDDANPFVKENGETARDIYERARALWRDIVSMDSVRLPAKSSHFPADIEAVANCIKLLRDRTICSTELDTRGAAYEEMLRNTFEKNENQQYFTPSSIVDFIVALADPSQASSICDPACGSGGFLISSLEKCRESGNEQETAFYGFDIDDRMIWVAKTNMLIHDGNPGNIHYLSHSGSLGRIESIAKYLPENGLDLILTNPPFGSDMTDEKALRTFITGKGRVSRRRSILFIERSLQLLAPGGELGVIVDDSVLNLDSNEDIRELIRREAIVVAVISLPDVAFMPYSTAKSSILLLRKKNSTVKQGPVFMAKADQVGKRPNGDVLHDETGTVVTDLPQILNAWLVFRDTGIVTRSEVPAIYSSYLEEDPRCRLDVNYYHPSRYESEKAIDSSEHPIFCLDELFDFMGGSIKPSQYYGDEPVEWIGLADIESNTGVFSAKTVLASSIKSQVHQYKAGDILVSRLRPELRKVVIIPSSSSGGICSSELIVLRKKSEAPVEFSIEYIANALRSNLAFGQEVFRITGLGRPRIGIPAIKAMRIPVPPMDMQLATVDKLDLALSEYRRVCADADRARREAHGGLIRAYEAYIDTAS